MMMMSIVHAVLLPSGLINRNYGAVMLLVGQ